MRATKTVLLPFAVAIPFLGFFLAIARRGLWDVDLIIRRATLVSVLTAVFVVVWLGIESAVQSFLASSLGSVPVVGGLAPALLAAGVVAVSRESVEGLLSRRLRAPGAPLGEAVQRMMDELGAVAAPEALAAGMVARLVEWVHPSGCALLLNQGGTSRWRAWPSRMAYPFPVAAAAAVGGLESSPHVVVLMDDGPYLATRIDRGGGIGGVLLMGPRPDGSFYSGDERQMLALFLRAVAPRLWG